jgi:bacteriocin-like protein
MSNPDQTKLVDPIRELTLDELQAVSGGGDGDDGGGPAPICPPCSPGH